MSEYYFNSSFLEEVPVQTTFVQTSFEPGFTKLNVLSCVGVLTGVSAHHEV